MTTTSRNKKQTARESALERRQRQAMMRTAAIAVVAVFLVGAAIFWVANETIKGQRDSIRPEAHPAEQIIADEGRGHVEEGQPLTFRHYPPSSGNHYPTWLPVGFYDRPFSEGYWVHNLEHGHIAILYRCPDGNCAELQNQIRSVIRKAPRRGCEKPKILALPYSTNMATPITLVAWGRQLDLVEFDEEAILNFYKRYEGQGPELVGCPN